VVTAEREERRAVATRERVPGLEQGAQGEVHA
jgi:hypothetical protein